MTDSVLLALNLKPEDKLIAIKEEKLADASFVLSSIMSYCFANDKSVCLVTLHNTIGHYHNIGKRLGYDLLNKIKEGHAKTIEPLKSIAEEISSENQIYLTDNKETIVKQLFLQIKSVTEDLLQNNEQTTVIIDDLSHLLDLMMDYKLIITFLNYCTGLTIKNNISLVVNCHVSAYDVLLLTNHMFHSADLALTVSMLKTGRSRNVSGVFIVNRKEEKNCHTTQRTFHYKLFEKEIRVFAPGRALI